MNDEELNEKFYGYHPKNSKNSEVFQVIQKMLYSMTETEYAKNYQQFKLLASETGLLYFLNNWACCEKKRKKEKVQFHKAQLKLRDPVINLNHSRIIARTSIDSTNLSFNYSVLKSPAISF